MIKLFITSMTYIALLIITYKAGATEIPHPDQTIFVLTLIVAVYHTTKQIKAIKQRRCK